MSRNVRLATASLMAALTAVSAYVTLPIGPVPITMQTCFVLLSGAVLGSRWGAGSQIVYVCLGLAGIPVFAGGMSGPGVVLSPTFGYIAGFVLAAFLTGRYPAHHHSPYRRRHAVGAGRHLGMRPGVSLHLLQRVRRGGDHLAGRAFYRPASLRTLRPG